MPSLAYVCNCLQCLQLHSYEKGTILPFIHVYCYIFLVLCRFTLVHRCFTFLSTYVAYLQ